MVCVGFSFCSLCLSGLLVFLSTRISNASRGEHACLSLKDVFASSSLWNSGTLSQTLELSLSLSTAQVSLASVHFAFFSFLFWYFWCSPLLCGCLAIAPNTPTEAQLSGVEPPPARDDPLQSKVTGLLEKKWTTILRLSKKKSELEARVRNLEAEVGELQAGGSSSGGRIRRTRDASNSLPQQPPAHTLKGHRDTITSVAFHPVFTLVRVQCVCVCMCVWFISSSSVSSISCVPPR
jgi:hypothetical protein